MIKHKTLQESLPAFAAGTLRKEQRLEFDQHVSTCAECREWLETYRLLETSLTPTEAHPPADDLARFALQSELDGGLDAHLASCNDCRREIELSRSAVAFARDGTDLQSASGRQAWRSAITGQRFAIAATLLLAVVSIPFLTLRLARETARVDYDLSGKSLGGNQTITAENSIMATRTVIVPGAEVTLRAGEVVALGEGFSVGSGASLIIEIQNTASSRVH